MSRKRILGLGIVLVLFASTAINAFAFGFENRVRWEIVDWGEGLNIQIWNGNPHRVRVIFNRHTWASGGFVDLEPDELRNVRISSRDARISNVLRWDGRAWVRF